jgi:hypothetical protein
MKRWGVLLGILAILGVAAAGYVGFRTVRPVTAQTLAAPPTVRAERGEVALGVTAPGRLVGTRETVLSFGATGKLLSLPVRAGQHVAAGATLARLDPDPLVDRRGDSPDGTGTGRCAAGDASRPAPRRRTWPQRRANWPTRWRSWMRWRAAPNTGELAAARAELAASEAALAQLNSPDATALQNCPIRAGDGQEQPVERAGGARCGLRRGRCGRL